MEIISLNGRKVLFMGKGIKELPLMASKKNPRVRRHQRAGHQSPPYAQSPPPEHLSSAQLDREADRILALRLPDGLWPAKHDWAREMMRVKRRVEYEGSKEYQLLDFLRRLERAKSAQTASNWAALGMSNKAIRDLPLSASKKNPAVRRHQKTDLSARDRPKYTASKEGMMRGYWKIMDTETGATINSGLTSKAAAVEIAEEMSKRHSALGKSVPIAIVLRKGKGWEHPISEAQRRWAFMAEDRGELKPGTAHKWSKRVKGKKLPEHTEEGRAVG